MYSNYSPDVFTSGKLDHKSDLHLQLAVKSYSHSQVGPSLTGKERHVRFSTPVVLTGVLKGINCHVKILLDSDNCQKASNTYLGTYRYSSLCYWHPK